ncbi:hypothetical protein [Pendulispora albinea]|uniref:Uncharacterized protein n=1 Tax=Pendulispora albinea TaxID=2741071 RepID=A0ABZ2LWV0_9BACT
MNDEQTSASSVMDRVDARAAALLERLSAESTETSSDVQDEGSENGSVDRAAETPATPLEVTKTATADEPAADDRLDRVATLEREARRRRQAVARQERELAAERERVADAGKKAADLEAIFSDPDRLLEALEQRVGYEKLTQWLHQQNDPAKRAELAAARSQKKELDPITARIDALEAENKRLHTEHLQAQVERALHSRITEVAVEAPYTARIMRKAPEALMQRVDTIVERMCGSEESGGEGLTFGVDFNLDHVIARVERALKAEHALYTDDEVTEPADQGRNDSSKSTGPAGKGGNGAKEQAKTLTNRDGSDRTTLETDGPRLSWDERIRRAEQRARRST